MLDTHGKNFTDLRLHGRRNEAVGKASQKLQSKARGNPFRVWGPAPGRGSCRVRRISDRLHRPAATPPIWMRSIRNGTYVYSYSPSLDWCGNISATYSNGVSYLASARRLRFRLFRTGSDLLLLGAYSCFREGYISRTFRQPAGIGSAPVQ